MNGKLITDIDLIAALETHRDRKALATLVCKWNQPRERFSQVLLNNEGNITGFGPFPNPNDQSNDVPVMFTGIQILEPEIFEFIPPGVFSHSTTDVYPRAIAEGRIIAAHISSGSWYELSTLERYLGISLEFLARSGKDLVCGAGTQIDNGAKVAESILWERVQVKAGARLHQVIVGDDVVVPPDADYQRVVIMRKDRCDEIERGEIVGENLIVPIL